MLKSNFSTFFERKKGIVKKKKINWAELQIADEENKINADEERTSLT